MPDPDDEHIQEDDDKRPRRRRRDDEEDYTDERPRRRRARDDDEYDDEDDDRSRRRRREMRDEDEAGGFLDDTFAKTSIVVLVLFSVLCGIVALLLSIAGVAACQRPLARRNALIVLIVSICWTAVATLLYVIRRTA